MARRNRNLTFHKDGFNEVVKHVIDTDGVKRMKRVADAANFHVDSDGYKVSTQGDNPLEKHDYSATVITADAEAIADNHKNNRLIHNLHLAGGE